MATLTVQDLVKSGAKQATYAAAAGGGDEMPNDGRTLLHVKNGSGGSITVTIAAQVTSRDFGGRFGPFTRSNIAEAIGAGQERFFGPFPKGAWDNAAGRVAITYSGVTSLTVAALKVPN